MTATAAKKVKDQELKPLGLGESSSVNQFVEFVPPNFKETEINEAERKNDFINIFICHLIFYAVFCVSIVLHIFIDLGLGSFVKDKIVQLIEISSNNVEKKPAFAC